MLFRVAANASSGLGVIVVNSAHKIPNFALTALRQHPVEANPILPLIEKRLSDPNDHHEQEIWVIVYTTSDQRVVLIGSCTQGLIGKYPLFVFTTVAAPYLQQNEYILPGLTLLAEQLLVSVPTQRVYSVFAHEYICLKFAEIWTQKTGIRSVPNPYYHAKISYVTRDTFREREGRTIPGAYVELRLARRDDLDGVAILCHLFSEDNIPFLLDQQGAYTEANALINSGYCWVYTVSYPHQPPVIACIVACTRNTERTATITKVVTHRNFRGRGCAEQLVRLVCRRLLQTRQYVVLYVGVENRAANVYNRVGFVGVGEGAPSVPGIDTYLELGFDRRHVELGYW